jgi:hypothetical protein
VALKEQSLILEAAPLIEAQRVLIRDQDAERHLSAAVGACALNGFLQQAGSQAVAAFGGVDDQFVDQARVGGVVQARAKPDYSPRLKAGGSGCEIDSLMKT